MEAADIQFRTAALGGFSKQDVLDYIEKANQDHAAKVEGLQKELSAMTEERDKLKARVEEAEGRLVELSAQVQKLTGELAERGAALEQSRGERELQAEEQSALQNQLSDLKERLEKSEQGASLRGHQGPHGRHRAGGPLPCPGDRGVAQEQVEKARQELEQWIYKVQAGYDRMRTDIEATDPPTRQGSWTGSAKAWSGLTAEFGDHDAELKLLLESYEEAIGPRMPKPLPLDEE